MDRVTWQKQSGSVNDRIDMTWNGSNGQKDTLSRLVSKDGTIRFWADRLTLKTDRHASEFELGLSHLVGTH